MNKTSNQVGMQTSDDLRDAILTLRSYEFKPVPPELFYIYLGVDEQVNIINYYSGWRGNWHWFGTDHEYKEYINKIAINISSSGFYTSFKDALAYNIQNLTILLKMKTNNSLLVILNLPTYDFDYKLNISSENRGMWREYRIPIYLFQRFSTEDSVFSIGFYASEPTNLELFSITLAAHSQNIPVAFAMSTVSTDKIEKLNGSVSNSLNADQTFPANASYTYNSTIYYIHTPVEFQIKNNLTEYADIYSDVLNFNFTVSNNINTSIISHSSSGNAYIYEYIDGTFEDTHENSTTSEFISTYTTVYKETETAATYHNYTIILPTNITFNNYLFHFLAVAWLSIPHYRVPGFIRVFNNQTNEILFDYELNNTNVYTDYHYYKFLININSSVVKIQIKAPIFSLAESGLTTFNSFLSVAYLALEPYFRWDLWNFDTDCYDFFYTPIRVNNLTITNDFDYYNLTHFKIKSNNQITTTIFNKTIFTYTFSYTILNYSFYVEESVFCLQNAYIVWFAFNETTAKLEITHNGFLNETFYYNPTKINLFGNLTSRMRGVYHNLSENTLITLKYSYYPNFTNSRGAITFFDCYIIIASSYRLESIENRQANNLLQFNTTRTETLLIKDIFGRDIYREITPYSRFIDITINILELILINEANRTVWFVFELMPYISISYAVPADSWRIVNILLGDYFITIEDSMRVLEIRQISISGTNKTSMTYREVRPTVPITPPSWYHTGNQFIDLLLDAFFFMFSADGFVPWGLLFSIIIIGFIGFELGSYYTKRQRRRKEIKNKKRKEFETNQKKQIKDLRGW